jgi:DNA processing protein
VVSGGARGTDEVAHLAAIRADTGTIVVLPTGILKPKLRREFSAHLQSGKVLLVSEFIPEQGWTAGCAMQRNRLLVALSKAIVLVEPGMTGGTAGTGTIAQKLGIPLYILDTPETNKEIAAKFFQQGTQTISAEFFDPSTLITNFQHAWEESEIGRNKYNTKPIFDI